MPNSSDLTKNELIAGDLKAMREKKKNYSREHEKLLTERQEIDQKIQNCWRDYFQLDQEIIKLESEVKE